MTTIERSPLPHALLWHGRPLSADDALVQAVIEAEAIQPIDQASVNGATLTVAELVAIRQFAYQSPHGSRFKLLFLSAADRLSPVVANALLKLLEEPPRHLIIRLAAERLDGVLPTIRSRCQVVFAGHGSTTSDRYPIATVEAMSRTELVALAETLAKDDELPAIVAHWLSELEQRLLQGYSVGASIAAGQTLVERLRSNINRRLALESWFLQLRGDTATDLSTDQHG